MSRSDLSRPALLSVAALTVVLWLSGAVVVESAVGVNWGTVSFHRLSPTSVVGLLKDNKIQKVKLFDADPDVLKSLMGSGIEVMIGIPNDMLAALSSSTLASDLWVRQNVSRYVGKGGADIRHLSSSTASQMHQNKEILVLGFNTHPAWAGHVINMVVNNFDPNGENLQLFK